MHNTALTLYKTRKEVMDQVLKNSYGPETHIIIPFMIED